MAPRAQVDKPSMSAAPQRRSSRVADAQAWDVDVEKHAASLRPATTWDFDMTRQKWIETPAMIHFPDEVRLQGGTRTCRKMILISDRKNRLRKVLGRKGMRLNEYVYKGIVQLYVAKQYIVKKNKEGKPKNVGHQIYFTDAVTQSVSEAYTQEFNRSTMDSPREQVQAKTVTLGYVPVTVMRLDDTKEFYTIEPFLSGRYQKFNDNYGYVHPSTFNDDPKATQHVKNSRVYSQHAQAFSHFTYHFSKGKLVVVDIQGVGSYYTDPQIHTFDEKGFGVGNLGQRGIEAFVKSHTCSQVCENFKLPEIGLKYEELSDTCTECPDTEDPVTLDKLRLT